MFTKIPSEHLMFVRLSVPALASRYPVLFLDRQSIVTFHNDGESYFMALKVSVFSFFGDCDGKRVILIVK